MRERKFENMSCCHRRHKYDALPTYRCGRFWLLEDLAQVRSIAISISSIGWENAEAFLAASSSTWVSFSATVDTASTTTSRRMDQVKLVAGFIKHLQRRDAEPASLEPNKISRNVSGLSYVLIHKRRFSKCIVFFVPLWRDPIPHRRW
jgi:hypothetical protein